MTNYPIRQTLFLLSFLLLYSCSSTKTIHEISGQTMGTTYEIKILTRTINKSLIKNDIDSILLSINNDMSTYIDSSIISKFNNSSTNLNIELSQNFIKVLESSINYYTISQGEFDVSINPLVKLWGFSDTKFSPSVPSIEKIDSVLNFIGLDKLKLSADGSYSKPNNMKLDFSAIAKGFAVDEISAYLKKKNYRNHSVDIGGEVRVAGYNNNKPWNIGIQDPSSTNISSYLELSLSNKSIATSGNYRNYFISDGNRYSHIISPTTGYPINNEIASVTVLSDYCIDADALATTLLLLGYSKGMKLIESLNGSEALFIYNNNSIKSSSGFNSYLD